MKTRWVILLIGLLMFAACSDEDSDPLGNWIEKSDFEGIPRGGATCFVINDVVYIGMGYNDDADNEYLSDFWMYDSSRNYWKQVATFPGAARTSAVAFSIDGKGYLGTGYDGNNKLNDFWEFDPSVGDSGQWTRKSDFGGSERYGAVGFVISGKGYIGSGYDGNDKMDFWEYNPDNDSWTQSISIGGSKRRNAVAFVYDGKAYVCTGINNGVYLDDLWRFDPLSASWTEMNSLEEDEDWSITRRNASAVVLDNKAYVLLGEKSGALNDVWEYDFSNDTWNEKTDFEGASRTETVVFVINDQMMVATGTTGSYYLDDVWEFRPFEEYDEDD